MGLKKGKKKLAIALTAVTVVLALVGGCAIYLGDYYRADQEAMAAFAPMAEATWHTQKNGNTVFEPEGATTGFIFYPGGKVEEDAYMPLMAALAEKGILCVLVKMPFRLAVLDMKAAQGIQQQHPQIERWYIGGHSLGGAMAASYLSDHREDFEGLVLLGAYSTADLSDSDLSVLSLYGSEDGVMDREKYEENRENLPADFREEILEGGCHAGFGMYGVQKGDGTPKVTTEEQIEATANAIALHIMQWQ